MDYEIFIHQEFMLYVTLNIAHVFV